ncbi:hypothetical protein HA402_014462 [Bradysia odoriphaga]|nr:hypothetical protein HA402_014462 [Bradysia odoriphaga]
MPFQQSFFYGESEELTKDIIRNYEDFKKNFLTRVNLSADWQYKIIETGIFIFKTQMNDNNQGVFVEYTIFVGLDLTVKVFHENRQVDSIFHDDYKLNLTKKCDEQNPKTIEAILVRALSVINEAQKFIAESPIEFEHENVIAVIEDQLLLLTQKKRKYRINSILYAYSIYLRSKSCYTMIRDENILILPHVTTLTSLTRFQDIGAGNESANLNYLKKIANNLSELEKVVTVQIDEIHCSQQVNFKASTLTGFAENEDAIAKTVLAFMISSCFGSMKEIAALIPASDPICEDLQRYYNEITSDLHSMVYKTLANVTDDNRLNQKFYSLLAPGGSHEHSYSENDKTFLIYDSIHIAKNVRNNWLNKKDYQKTFCAGKLITKAYKLNKKTLYPSNFERQRVPLLLNILHPSTIAALRENATIDVSGGTANFLDLWRVWFAIMNNRSTTKDKCLGLVFLLLHSCVLSTTYNLVSANHALTINLLIPTKGYYENDIWSTPIKSENDFQVDFLKKFAKWLRHWRLLDNAGVGLTRDTFDAAIITTEKMIELIEHSFKNYSISFFLPGKFQTNDLEWRFGRYRNLCGSNYLVSYKDILEAETKLRIKSLVSSYPHELNTSKYSVTKKKEPDVGDYMCILNADFLGNFKNHDYGAFLYVCGYGAYSYMQTLSCTLCHNLILKAKGEYTNVEYFDFLQGGGLVVPTENCHIILLHMNAILEEIVRTDNVKRENCVLITINLLDLTNVSVPLPLSVCKYNCGLLGPWDPDTIVLGRCNSNDLKCCLLG